MSEATVYYLSPDQLAMLDDYEDTALQTIEAINRDLELMEVIRQNRQATMSELRHIMETYDMDNVR